MTAAHPTQTSDGADWVPVDACTMPTADQALRVAEFDELFSTAVQRTEYVGDATTHARIVLAGDETLPARVQALTDAETACCSFFGFTLTLDRGSSESGDVTVILDVQVPAAQSAVLAALLRRAELARAEAG